MKYFVLFVFCLSVYFFLRALSFVLTYISMYNYRVKECIERILGQQKACDLLNAVYQFFVMLVSLYFAVECFLLFFDISSVMVFNVASFVAITIAHTSYFVLRFKMETGHDLCNFYNHMIDYRSKQKVVTQDNDDEVSFIRSYRKVMKHKRDMNILYLISLATLVYAFLQDYSGLFE